MSFGDLHALDDLGSFDDSEGPDSPTRQRRQSNNSNLLASSPSSPRIPYYNPVGLTIGETSPGGRSLNSDLSSYSRNQSHSVNAVHMHVQDNARIPTYPHNVDRSNSNRPISVPYSTTNQPNSNKEQPEPCDVSMAELFLSKESKHRQSLNQNYESLGSLLEDFGPAGDSKLAAEDETQMEIDALTAAIDPTPWSEIERKMHKPAQPSTTSHPHHYNYYPYGRHHQLPIPQTTSSPTRPIPSNTPSRNAVTTTPAVRDPTMAQALATAAAIASTQATTTTTATTPVKRSPSISPPPPTVSSPSARAPPAAPYTKAQQTTTMEQQQPRSMNSMRHSYLRQRANYAPPKHSNAHTTTRASVIAATNQKSQYGFGGNHKIPSVPAPPPTSNGRKHNNISLPSIPSLTGSTTPPNAGAAYERKKQRAKDARVKLNEAIERLSVSMSMAGSQSKQRHSLLGNRIPRTEHRTQSLQMTDECYKLAEQAKKWDRPSFVGTAATLIQALNSQCDSLVREVMALQGQLEGATGETTNGGGDCGQQLTSHPEHKRHGHPVSSLNGDVLHATKRVRAISMKDENNNFNNGHLQIHHVHVSGDEKTIFGGVAKMLDPVSLSRCPFVSRSWRDMEVFDSDDSWLHLAVQRFGFYNVRQWTEKLEDGDGGKNVTKKALYRAMNAANVMPHIQQEGVYLLGDAKITGRISGWVFIVERSNGETLRSVKREPGSSGHGTYQSRPVVELRIVIQNTGMGNNPVVIKNQNVSVDISTRRSGGELHEIHWDERFLKVVKHLDGTVYNLSAKQSMYGAHGELCRLGLFEAVMMEVHIDARGCYTLSKFQQRSNFTKLLVCLEGTTVPMVVPFLRDGSHGNH